jgi:hypothetical protein
MIRSRHPPFSGSPKKNISIWCREISPWISQCWFNQPFSGPGGYQVGFIDPMTNISKQCNMSVGKSRKRKQQHTYMCCFTWLWTKHFWPRFCTGFTNHGQAQSG